ncbi:unnamed protein product, partial [Adineta steineri]
MVGEKEEEEDDDERKSTTTSTSTTTLPTTSTSTTTLPTTSTSTTSAVAYANGTYSFWPMENNAVDIISGLDGKGVNSPTYVTPDITGSGYALKLIRNSNQYITIPIFKSFVNTSFTVEMWIYPTTLINGGYYFGLFTQYDGATKDHSLQMMIRGLQLTLDFYGGGVNGATSLATKP